LGIKKEFFLDSLCYLGSDKIKFDRNKFGEYRNEIKKDSAC